MKSMLTCLVFSLALVFGGCNRAENGANPAKTGVNERAAAPTNRVDIPPAVRTNLGITFGKVERRAVASTIRLPGRFEFMPEGRREHRAPVSGQIEIVAPQFKAVESGDVLYRLDSPQWRDMQREMSEAAADADIAQARLASLDPIMEAHRLHEQGLREAVELWTARARQLEELGAAGGGRASELAEARANLTSSRAAFGEVLEKDAELQMQRSEAQSQLRRAQSQLDQLLGAAAAVTGLPREQLSATSWLEIAQVEVRSAISGVVEHLDATSGTWIEQGEPVLSVVDPDAVRFRATALQSDLARLRDELPASIVPTQVSTGSESAISATLKVGLEADPQLRTIALFATPSRREHWSRAGVAAFLEIVTEQAGAAELAIPHSAVVRDGVQPIIFRRDPANPDKVIRMEADLGLSDGRWVVINSGVKEGDEVVLDGVHQLLMATSSTAAKGGHFHSDGTFHAEDHD